MRHFDDAGNSARARVCKPPEPGLITRVMKSVSASPQTERPASVMIEKFATLTGKVPSEFLDLNHTSKSIILVSRHTRSTFGRTNNVYKPATASAVRCDRT